LSKAAKAKGMTQPADPIAIARDLIRCPSVTPAEGGALATVGSSNLDPLSLLLAREANVFVDDAAFSARLRASLLEAIERAAEPVPPGRWQRQSIWSRARIWIAFQLARLFIAFAGIDRYH